MEEELPEPGRGEVRVRILAAGVSYADLLMREGVSPETPRLPFTPRWDLVGVVDRVGDGVEGAGAGIHGAADSIEPLSSSSGISPGSRCSARPLERPTKP